MSFKTPRLPSNKEIKKIRKDTLQGDGAKDPRKLKDTRFMDASRGIPARKVNLKTGSNKNLPEYRKLDLKKFFKDGAKVSRKKEK